MTYLEKLKCELVMSERNDGWYNEWIREKIKKIEKNGKSKKNSK